MEVRKGKRREDFRKNVRKARETGIGRFLGLKRRRVRTVSDNTETK